MKEIQEFFVLLEEINKYISGEDYFSAYREFSIYNSYISIINIEKQYRFFSTKYFSGTYIIKREPDYKVVNDNTDIRMTDLWWIEDAYIFGYYYNGFGKCNPGGGWCIRKDEMYKVVESLNCFMIKQRIKIFYKGLKDYNLLMDYLEFLKTHYNFESLLCKISEFAVDRENYEYFAPLLLQSFESILKPGFKL